MSGPRRTAAWAGLVSAVERRWRSQAAEMPVWILEEELDKRRGQRPDPVAVRLPGLEVDPVGSRMVWGGVEHAVTGREMEVLYALAVEAAKGKRRVSKGWLAVRVFRGFDAESALGNLRTYVTLLNRKFPGLMLMASENGKVLGSYGLNLPEAEDEAVA